MSGGGFFPEGGGMFFTINMQYQTYFKFCLNTVCEYSSMLIECPTGKINIDYANYRRTDGKVCSSRTISRTDCRAQDSEEIVKNECDGKTNCSIHASNSVFGDPCGGTPKYLEVKFTCV